MMPWQTDVHSQKAHARCVQCGSTELAGVCHECGAGLCQEHLPRLDEQPWYRSFPEFRGLNLARTEMGDTGLHCTAHFHYTYTLDFLIWFGTLLGFASFFFSLVLTWRNLGASIWGWFIVIVGLFMVLVGLLFSILHTDRQRARKVPPLPVLGRFPAVEARETIVGGIVLDGAGVYRGEVERASGRWSYRVRFITLDRERRRLYQQEYRRRTPADLHFSAGFLVGKGDARLDFQGKAAEQQRQSNTLELSAPISQNPFLSGVSTAAAGPPINARWSVGYPYVFGAGRSLPVQIITALVADGEEFGLEFLVQMAPWPKLDLQDVPIRVERFKLCAPDALGRPLVWSPAAQLEPTDDRCSDAGFHSLVWKDVPFSASEGEDGEDTYLELAQPYARFYVRFENYRLLKHHTVHGQLQVRLENKLLSGLEEVALYYPLGQPREEATLSCETGVTVGFSLNLRQLQFRGIRSFSEKLQLAAVPDYQLIVPLVQRLEARGIYVKRVVENPPHTSRASARMIGHAWQIDGRCYEGVYPLDFQLAVTGLEIYEDEPWPARGETTFDLRVTANIRTKEMYEQLQQLLEEVATVLRGLAGGGQPGSGAGPIAGPILPIRPSGPSGSSPRPPRPWLNT